MWSLQTLPALHGFFLLLQHGSSVLPHFWHDSTAGWPETWQERKSFLKQVLPRQHGCTQWRRSRCALCRSSGSRLGAEQRRKARHQRMQHCAYAWGIASCRLCCGTHLVEFATGRLDADVAGHLVLHNESVAALGVLACMAWSNSGKRPLRHKLGMLDTLRHRQRHRTTRDRDVCADNNMVSRQYRQRYTGPAKALRNRKIATFGRAIGAHQGTRSGCCRRKACTSSGSCCA